MKALRVCDSLPDLLAATALSLRVHSVFTHACNLQTPGRELLTLLSRTMPLVPRGCVLPYGDLRDLFEPGICLSVRDGVCLVLPEFSIDLAGASRVGLRVSDIVVYGDGTELYAALQRFLPEAPPEQGIYPLLHGASLGRPVASVCALRSAIDALDRWLRRADAAVGLEQAVHRLVGYGTGLTPAADDFLLGVLLTMDMFGDVRRDELGTALRACSGRTTDISAAAFANACDGRYAEPQLALWAARPTHLTAALKAVASHGHSSGHDTLCGVEFALRSLGRLTQALPQSELSMP